MLKLSTDTSSVQAGEMTLTLDEIAREGARRMLQAALEAEVAAYLERFRGERDERGHALVVRNGKARPRRVTLGAGTVAWTRANSSRPARCRSIGRLKGRGSFRGRKLRTRG